MAIEKFHSQIEATAGRQSSPFLVRWMRDLVDKIQERMEPTDVKTADYSAQPWDFVQVDPSGGAINITLPRAGLWHRAEIGVKNITTSVNTVTITAFTDADYTEYIVDDGDYATATITVGGGSITMIADAKRERWVIE
jgi:hypothetical protein